MRIRRTLQEIDFIAPQVSPEIAADPVSWAKSLTPRQRILLNHLFKFSSANRRIYIRQDTLAYRAKYKSREQANRFLGKLIKDGVIASNYRHKTSCIYKVSDFFKDPKIRELLLAYFTCFFVFPGGLLNGFQTKFKGVVTQTKPVKYLLVSSSRAVTGTRTHEESSMQVKDYVEAIIKPIMTFEEKTALSQYSKEAVADAQRALQRKQAEGSIDNPVRFLIGCARAYNPSFAPKNTNRLASAAAPKKEGTAQPQRVWTQQELDQQARKSIAYGAQLRGESDEYIQSILSDPRRPFDIKYGEDWNRQRAYNQEKSLKSHKGNGGIPAQGEMQTHPSLSGSQTTRERLAQMAARQLGVKEAGFPPAPHGTNPGSMAQLLQGLSKKMTPPTIENNHHLQKPETQTTIELDEPEPSGGYSESNCEEILP